MLLHVNDAVSLQGARILQRPFTVPYGAHTEYELQVVTGRDNAPVDIESRGCVKWTLTITPSPETPTKVLAYAVFADNIATGNSLRFDFAATSVEMYKHVAGNPATPAILQLQGFTDDVSPATVIITFPVALVTSAQQRLPVDLSTALMQELQLATSVVGAAQREISKHTSESTDAADRAEQAAINAHASEVNAQGSATAAGISAGNARASEDAAEGSAISAAGSASDALVSAEAAHASELAALTSEQHALASENAARASEQAASASEAGALASQNAAHASEQAAATSEQHALASENAARASEQAAAQSASTAATHEGNASASANAAAASAQAAAASETNAGASDTSAQLAAQAAEYARNGAVDAKVLAETAQSAAESAAADAADETADAIEEQFRDDIGALSAAVNSAQSAATQATASQQSASASATSAQQSAAEAYEYAQQAGLNTVLILDAPPTVNTAAAVGKLAVWHDAENNKDHLYHCCYITEGESATLYHWEECVLVSMGNVAGGYPILDANGKIASAQLPPMDYIPTSEKGAANGVAGLDENALVLSSNLPIGSDTSNGTFRVSRNNGIDVVSSTQRLRIIRALQNDIDAKTNQYNPIVPVDLDYAVRSVLPLVTEIPAATSDYSLVDSFATTNNHSHVYSHSPSVAPTYRLPQVTNTTIAHYIELTVDFAAVQTYSFLDYQGEPIVPLFTPSIAAGDVYTFKCEYSAVKAAWLIYPQKQGAVADDFVMRGEVGVANGVPSLDANAKVPSGQLPIASGQQIGAISINSGYGITILNGYPVFAEPTNSGIDSRVAHRALILDKLNYAVRAAITDSNHITLTDAQKATAQSVFGVGGDIVGTGAPTTSTVGKVMDSYLDTATGKTYTCTAVTVDDTDPNNPVTTYTWTDDVNANGGVFRNSIQVNNANNYANTRIRSQGHIDGGFQCDAGTSAYGAIAIGYYATALSSHGAASFGTGTRASYQSQLVTGKYTVDKDAARLTGNGINGNNRRNIEELSWNGDLYIAGGHQQGITEIPAATTAYTLAEGVQSHAPEAASVYTLPAVTDATRTHECILTIKFSASVLTYEFQDSAGTTLVPLPLNGDIEDGSVVTFLCRYNPLLAQWVIYPIMDGKEAA